MTPEHEELLARLESSKRGCPTCGGIDPRSCLRCFGKTSLAAWYSIDAAAAIRALKQQVAELTAQVKRVEAHEKQLCDWIKIASGPELTAAIIKRAEAAERRLAEMQAALKGE